MKLSRDASSKEHKAWINLRRKILLGFAMFLKGGLLGCYMPFYALWLQVKGYSASQVGTLYLVDVICSIVFMPLIGMVFDKLRIHNVGLSIIMFLVACLNSLYLPFAQSYIILFVLSMFTGPLLRAANSILDAQALYAFPEKGDFPKVRLFGGFGYGCFALLVGYICVTHESSPTNVQNPSSLTTHGQSLSSPGTQNPSSLSTHGQSLSSSSAQSPATTMVSPGGAAVPTGPVVSTDSSSASSSSSVFWSGGQTEVQEVLKSYSTSAGQQASPQVVANTATTSNGVVDTTPIIDLSISGFTKIPSVSVTGTPISIPESGKSSTETGKSYADIGTPPVESIKASPKSQMTPTQPVVMATAEPVVIAATTAQPPSDEQTVKPLLSEQSASTIATTGNPLPSEQLAGKPLDSTGKPLDQQDPELLERVNQDELKAFDAFAMDTRYGDVDFSAKILNTATGLWKNTLDLFEETLGNQKEKKADVEAIARTSSPVVHPANAALSTPPAITRGDGINVVVPTPLGDAPSVNTKTKHMAVASTESAATGSATLGNNIAVPVGNVLPSADNPVPAPVGTSAVGTMPLSEVNVTNNSSPTEATTPTPRQKGRHGHDVKSSAESSILAGVVVDAGFVDVKKEDVVKRGNANKQEKVRLRAAAASNVTVTTSASRVLGKSNDSVPKIDAATSVGTRDKNRRLVDMTTADGNSGVTNPVAREAASEASIQPSTTVKIEKKEFSKEDLYRNIDYFYYIGCSISLLSAAYWLRVYKYVYARDEASDAGKRRIHDDLELLDDAGKSLRDEQEESSQEEQESATSFNTSSHLQSFRKEMAKTMQDILYSKQNFSNEDCELVDFSSKKKMLTSEDVALQCSPKKSRASSNHSSDDSTTTAIIMSHESMATRGNQISVDQDESFKEEAEDIENIQTIKNRKRLHHGDVEDSKVNTEVVRILFMLWVLGVCFGLIGTYEFMLLREFGVGTDFMGMCRFVGVVCEAPMWYYSSELLDYFGINNAQLLALFGNGLRFSAYGRVDSGYDVLFMEWTHGFMFAIPYATVSVFTARIASEKTKGTIQSLIITLFVGIGAGSGIVLGGLSIDYVFEKNIQALFRTGGHLALLVATIIFVRDQRAKVWDKVVACIRGWC